ncbi:MAG: 1,4-dihydroxy-2-naphthoate polyprenyltransferase [Tannerella sp.]|jgi:1,4-dihydroxy-2-naphthoate octaprenyltransferase|nr:1,4-dihydroxy-2-naphthoate polyprenyltransferase [Tannerella sp.]
MKPSQTKAWILAMRPKTLAASVSPVLVASALACRHGSFYPVPAALCLLVALFAQIASNFSNDYFDFKKGADNAERLGQARAVASGWIKPETMLYASLGMLALACICGCGLLYYGGPELILVGIAIVSGVLAYTAGPYPLAYRGWGDICVLVFYGLIPVCFTYYVQTGQIVWPAFWLSLAVGFQSVNILTVNNYRDHDQDKAAGKRTTIVIFGRSYGRVMYLIHQIAAYVCAFPAYWYRDRSNALLFIFLFILQLFTWQDFIRLQGSSLNSVLEQTARNVFLFALLIATLLFF